MPLFGVMSRWHASRGMPRDAGMNPYWVQIFLTGVYVDWEVTVMTRGDTS